MTDPKGDSQMDWKFRDLSTTDFKLDSKKTLASASEEDFSCHKLACRTCAASWILDDLKSSFTKRPITIGQAKPDDVDVSSLTRFNIIKEHFESLSWNSKRRPGFLVPSWNIKDAGKLFKFFIGPGKQQEEADMKTVKRLGFEIDAFYLNGFSLTIVATFLDGNFRTKSNERGVFGEKTIANALLRIEREYNSVQRLLEAHGCLNIHQNYLLFFPYVNIDKVSQGICRSESFKSWVQSIRLKLGFVAKDNLFNHEVIVLEMGNQQPMPRKEALFNFIVEARLQKLEWNDRYRHLAASLILSKKMSNRELKFIKRKPRSAEKILDVTDCKTLQPDDIRADSGSTNDPMTKVLDIMRDRPTAVDIADHTRIVEGLSENQQLAVSCLQDIIRSEKNGELLMSDNVHTKSNLGLLPTLLGNDWFASSDLKEFEIEAHALPWKTHYGTLPLSQWEINHLYEANHIQKAVSQALNIASTKVLVRPQELTLDGERYTREQRSTLGYVPPYAIFEFAVTVNGKNENLPDKFQLEESSTGFYDQQTVYLKNVDDSKANQIPVFQLKPEDLDERGDKDFSLSEQKTVMRGGMEYKQPSGYWLRVGLRVTGMYDDGNDKWLAKNGNSDEWAVGFHGSKSSEGNDGILTSREVRPGARQAFQNDDDVNDLSDNRGLPCGEGSYFADDIEISAENYSVELNGRKCVFQARICPWKTRIPKNQPEYRIVSETKYARPYGICIRK